MANPQVQADPVFDLPLLGVRGLLVSNDANTPDSILNISAGIARDSNNIMDLAVGSSFPNLEGSSVAAPLSIDATLAGAGGLDTGSLAASKVYAVYVIGDSHYYRPVAGMISLASSSSPLMPFGYDSYRLVGYAVTDSSVDFLPFYSYGNGSWRMYCYDAPQASAVTAGAATSYTAVALTALVPPVENLPVSIAFAFTPNAASDTLKMTPGNGTGDAVTITGQVASVVVSDNVIVMSKVTSAVPEIDYKVSTGSAAVAINVAGFMFSV